MKQSVTTYFLEMSAPSELRPSAAQPPSLRVEQAQIVCPELSRFLYTAVGGDWYWTSRLKWSYQQWAAHLQRPELETWIGYVDGTPAGYFELEQQARATVEITCFGLLRQFIGQGIGGALLTAAIRRAWQRAGQRVWVHTCSLDGPNALRNYQARGFQLYDQVTQESELPDQPPGPWPNARPAPSSDPQLR
jgi:GNAT superfamily N-acetyltransferase